jgi:hypothetical protein
MWTASFSLELVFVIVSEKRAGEQIKINKIRRRRTVDGSGCGIV